MLSDADKGFLINYILINKNWLRLRSRGLYQELERTAQLSHLRWQTMRAFMMFNLKNEINTSLMYSLLDADDKDKLLNGKRSEAGSKLSPAERKLYVKNEPKATYTDSEDLEIITYMLQDDHYKNIKKSCEQLASTRFYNAKTASSVRERFMRRIRLKLDTHYPFLNEAQRALLRGPARISPDAANDDIEPNKKRRKPANRRSKREKLAAAAEAEAEQALLLKTSKKRCTRASTTLRAADEKLFTDPPPAPGRRSPHRTPIRKSPTSHQISQFRQNLLPTQAPPSAAADIMSILSADSSALWQQPPLYDNSLTFSVPFAV